VQDAKEFLSSFPGNHVFCAIDDKSKDRKPYRLPIHYHEGYELSRDDILAKLRIKNENEYGIFFCVNEIDRRKDPQRHRTSTMLKSIRAIWADDDEIRETPRNDFPIIPNIVVETSKGKFHYYWLTTTDEIEEWGYVMNGIANKFNTDGNAKDLVRVLRIPGFKHNKKEPYESTFYVFNEKPYSWLTIVNSFPPDNTIKSKSVREKRLNGAVNLKFASFNDAREAIVEGTNFHGSILWLLNHWVNCGIKNPDELLALINDIMDRSKVQDERWEARIRPEYLSANITDAIRFVKDNPLVSDIEIPKIEIVEYQLNTGYPPGLMGILCENIFETAPHANEEVSLMASFALVAGIIGRSYNVLGTGLNLYVALLADTGIGKAVLKNTINTILLKKCVLEGGPSFKGASRFTGPKALFDMMAGGLSRVCVLEESGLMSESTAGDQKGLTRVMLDIFSSSGAGEYAGGESYSNSENTIPAIPSPALTIAHVSTPLSYLRALKAKDATVSGDIARIWVMRSMRDKKKLNTHRRKEFDPKILVRIKDLIRKCLPQQNENSSKIINVDTSNINIQVDSDYWTNIENKYKREGDQLRRAMASRSFIKIIKIASITSIMNGLNGIGQQEYKWAGEAIEGEIKTIEEALSYGASDDMMIIVKNLIAPVVSKILNNGYNDRKKSVPKGLKGKGIFTSTNLSQCLRNNEVLRRMNDDPERQNPRSGVEKMLYYMMRNGLIVVVHEDKLRIMGVRTKVAYKVTDDFVLLMEE
jgi:hypothetical protein